MHGYLIAHVRNGVSIVLKRRSTGSKFQPPLTRKHVKVAEKSGAAFGYRLRLAPPDLSLTGHMPVSGLSGILARRLFGLNAFSTLFVGLVLSLARQRNLRASTCYGQIR
jgi:hypothetical protein